MVVTASYNKEMAYEHALKLINFKKKMNTLNRNEIAAITTILEKGAVYIYGSDKQFRPVIIIRLEDGKVQILIKNGVQLIINDYILAIKYLLELVKTQILVPYYVEKWTIIFDMNFQSFTQLEILEASESFSEFQIYFCGNLNCILLVNCPDDVDNTIRILSDGFDFTKMVIQIKTCKQISELLGYISQDQLEQRYGGMAANLTKFWPPIIIKQGNNSSNFDEFVSENQQQKDNEPKGISEKNLVQLKSNSHASIENSSLRKGSLMKIMVIEENGNALMEQEINISDEFSEEDFEKDISEDDSRHASEFQAFTVKQENEMKFQDKKFNMTTTKAYTKMKQQSLKSDHLSKGSDKVALEGERNCLDECCSSKQCCVF